MARNPLRNAAATGDDSGMAMVMVVGAMMVLAVFAMAALAYAMSSQRFARHDQDYAAAMTAAQSGVEDYIAHLNRNNDYAKTVDCANLALQSPTAATGNACGWHAGTAYGWLPVEPGATDPAAASFHLEANAASLQMDGTVMLTATGRVNGTFRTIEVAVGKGGSTDYVYYTDFESADPQNKVAYPSGALKDTCGLSGPSNARYYWETGTTAKPARKDSNCSEIQFPAGDTLTGRVFSNDAILSMGATFKSSIESLNPGCRNVVPATRSTWNRCLRNTSGVSAVFGDNVSASAAPKYADKLVIDDNSASFSTLPGCHYYGATRIIFAANGTMQVWSPAATQTSLVLSFAPSDGRPAPICGDRSALASIAGANVPVPPEMVVYVGEVPASVPVTSIPNRQIFADEIGGPTAAERLPLGTYSASTPSSPARASDSYTYDLNMADANKYLRQGNMYVQGTVNGRVTLATQQSIIVTGDLVLASDINNGDDIVGLVAQNSVEVMHPRMVTVKASGGHWLAPTNEQEPSSPDYGEGTWPKRVADWTGVNVPAVGIQIDASIQTLQHSLFVQMYDKGPNLGQLIVRGSIAQRWRGAVGTAGTPITGYLKSYLYDDRLHYSAPPYFPHWVNAQWSLRYSGEIKTPNAVKP